MIVAVWVATGLCCVYYLFLVTNGDFDLFAPEPLGTIFDHMAWQLLHWRFTIEPEVVGKEAFLWHGGTYSYFGIFPALLRLPLVLMYGADPPSLSRLSCWVVCIIAAGSTSIFLHARPHLPRTQVRDFGIFIALAATLLTGPTLSMTFTAWVYNEPVIWGTALAMAFLRVLLAQVTMPPSPSGTRWLAMGAFSGLAFSARPVPAVGMTVALALAVLLGPSAPSTIQAPSGMTAQLAGMVRAAVRCAIGFLPLFGVALLVNLRALG